MNDVKFAIRQLLKNPGFTTVAVLTLGLGIGINTTFFRAFNALVLRPLQVKDPGTVVNLWSGYGLFSYPEYCYYRDHCHVLSDLVACAPVSLILDGAADEHGSHASGAFENLRGLLVTGNYLSALGARAELGRIILPEEDRLPGANPVVALSHNFWVRRFNRDPNILGRSLRLNNSLLTVVGIIDKDFGGTRVELPDVYVPMTMQATLTGSDQLSDGGSWWLDVVGRLKSSVTLSQAQAALTVAANQFRLLDPERNKTETVTLTPGSILREDKRRKVIAGGVLVLAAVGTVLLIACANVAGLLLARAAARQKEIGIRLALGAGRNRIIRQLLTESLLIGLLGGAAGLLLSGWLSGFLSLIHPAGEPPPGVSLAADTRVFAYAFIASLLSTLIFGLVPALQTSKTDVSVSLKDGDEALGRRLSRSRLRGVLVAGQVAVGLILLMGSGLLIRGWQRSQRIDPGLQTKNVVVAELPLQLNGYDSSRALTFHRGLKERLESTPGVKSVTEAAIVPLGPREWTGSFAVVGREQTTYGHDPSASFNVVAPRFFETLNIPFVRGRDFSDSDVSLGTPVAIVNEAMVGEFMPGQNGLGRQIRIGKVSCEIVGVVKNTRSVRLGNAAEAALYLPALPPVSGQTCVSPQQTNILDLKLLVRTEGSPGTIAASLIRFAKEIDPNVPISASVLEANLERWISPARIGALVSSGLGLMALLLAAAGIYGVVGQTVSQRTREIGVRMALGAQRNDVLLLVLQQGLRPIVIGMVLGLGGSLAATRVLSGMLFDLSPLDPVTFVLVPVLLVVVALMACLLPARRATRINPIKTLRYE